MSEEEKQVAETREASEGIPVELSLHIQNGFDLSKMTEIDKAEQRLLYCAELCTSIFRVMQVALDNSVDLCEDLKNIAVLGEAVNNALLDELDTVDFKSLSLVGRKRKKVKKENKITLISNQKT